MPEVIVYLGKSGSGKSYHCWNDPAYQQSGYKYPVQQNGKVYFDGNGGKVLSGLTSLGEASFPSTYSSASQTSTRPESRPREEASVSSGCARSSSPRPSSPKTGGQSPENVKRYHLSFAHFLPKQMYFFTPSHLSSILSLQSSVLINSNLMYIRHSTRGNTTLFKESGPSSPLRPRPAPPRRSRSLSRGSPPASSRSHKRAPPPPDPAPR